MFSLQPYEYFTLFIQLDNHTDTERDNYFVQSVVRNARTSELIATVNLDSKGEGEYSKPWQVPADPTGLGLYIKVVTTVYSDSNHMTKVALYGQEGGTYLIADRHQPHAGGSSVDYKKIQAMIDGAISKIKIPEYQAPALDLKPVLAEISKLYKALNEFPRYKDSTKEINDVREGVLALSPMLKALDKPEKEVDLSPILNKIGEMSNRLNSLDKIDSLSEVDKAFRNFMNTFKDEFNNFLNVVRDFDSRYKNLKFNLQVNSDDLTAKKYNPRKNY